MLASLPPGSLESVSSKLRSLTVKLGHVLFGAGESIDALVFPTTAVVSLVVDIDQHKSIEVAMVGNEGVVGLPLMLGTDRSILRGLVQYPGEVLCLDVEDVKQEIAANPAFAELLMRYIHVSMVYLAQSAACIRGHVIEQRAARWLLTMQDRSGSDRFELTHDILAQMLGIRRASVTELARTLQLRGLIQQERGELIVKDRKGLEQLTCSCYWVVRNEIEALVAPKPSSQSAG